MARRTRSSVTPKSFAAQPAAEPDVDVKIYVRATYSYEDKAGGWGAVIVNEGGEQELSATEQHTTENQLLLNASIRVLESFETPIKAAVYTDSEYLQKGMSQWIKGWIKKGWKTASGQPVKNQELWERLQQAAQKHQIVWFFSPASQSFMQRAFELAKKSLG